MAKTHIKYYKTAPKHPYWLNDGRIEKVTGTNGINHYEFINIETNKKSGAFIRGYRLFKGYKKATEDDWNKALANISTIRENRKVKIKQQ